MLGLVVLGVVALQPTAQAQAPTPSFAGQGGWGEEYQKSRSSEVEDPAYDAEDGYGPSSSKKGGWGWPGRSRASSGATTADLYDSDTGNYDPAFDGMPSSGGGGDRRKMLPHNRQTSTWGSQFSDGSRRDVTASAGSRGSSRDLSSGSEYSEYGKYSMNNGPTADDIRGVEEAQARVAEKQWIQAQIRGAAMRDPQIAEFYKNDPMLYLIFTGRDVRGYADGDIIMHALNAFHRENKSGHGVQVTNEEGLSAFLDYAVYRYNNLTKTKKYMMKSAVFKKEVALIYKFFQPLIKSQTSYSRPSMTRQNTRNY